MKGLIRHWKYSQRYVRSYRELRIFAKVWKVLFCVQLSDYFNDLFATLWKLQKNVQLQERSYLKLGENIYQQDKILNHCHICTRISKVVPSVLYRWKKLPYLLVVSNVTLCASCGISLNVVRINKITCNCMYKRQKMAFEMLISPFFCDLLFLPSYCRQR